MERRSLGGGAPAGGEVPVGAADVLPVEVGALHAEVVAARRAQVVAVEREGVRLAVEDLRAGRVAPGLVHAQPAGEAHVLHDAGVQVEVELRGVGDVVVVVGLGRPGGLHPDRRCDRGDVLGFVVLGLLVVIGLSLWVTTSTTRRIRRVVAAADRLALGDVSVDEQLDTRAADETALLEGFARFVST